MLFYKEIDMKEIKVLGTGCTKCQLTTKLIQDISNEKGVDIALEKVEDIEKITSYNVMSTPAVVIDGHVVHAGGIPARSKVEGWFQ
jgi:small redox-active disulfide protein 2